MPSVVFVITFYNWITYSEPQFFQIDTHVLIFKFKKPSFNLFFFVINQHPWIEPIFLDQSVAGYQSLFVTITYFYRLFQSSGFKFQMEPVEWISRHLYSFPVLSLPLRCTFQRELEETLSDAHWREAPRLCSVWKAVHAEGEP